MVLVPTISNLSPPILYILDQLTTYVYNNVFIVLCQHYITVMYATFVCMYILQYYGTVMKHFYSKECIVIMLQVVSTAIHKACPFRCSFPSKYGCVIVTHSCSVCTVCAPSPSACRVIFRNTGSVLTVTRVSWHSSLTTCDYLSFWAAMILSGFNQ